MPRRKRTVAAKPAAVKEPVVETVTEEPVETPAPPAEEPAVEEPAPVVEPEPVVEEPAPEPEPVEASAVRVGGYVATEHGWKPVH